MSNSPPLNMHVLPRLPKRLMDVLAACAVVTAPFRFEARELPPLVPAPSGARAGAAPDKVIVVLLRPGTWK